MSRSLVKNCWIVGHVEKDVVEEKELVQHLSYVNLSQIGILCK
jgi:hypothetical protein